MKCGCSPGSYEKALFAELKDGDIVKYTEYAIIKIDEGKAPVLKTIPVDNRLTKVEGEEYENISVLATKAGIV